MKTVLIVAFYLAAAVCLWPLYQNAAEVVAFVREAMAQHRLIQLPPIAVLVAAAQAVLLLWAIPAAVVLFRKGQDSFAWLVVLLVLVPMAGRLALGAG